MIVACALVLYLERGGRTLLSFSDRDAALAAAADQLARTAQTGRLGRLNVQRGDGTGLRTEFGIGAGRLRIGGSDCGWAAIWAPCET